MASLYFRYSIMMRNLHIISIALAQWCAFLFMEWYKNIWSALIRWGASASLPAGLSKLVVQVGSVYELHVKMLENSPSLIKENHPEAWNDIEFWQGRLRMEKERPAKTWHTGEYTNLLQVLHQTPDECPEILTRIGSSRWLPPTSDQTKAGIKKYCCRFSQWDSSKNTVVNIVSWIEIEKNSRVNEYEVTNG